MQCSPLGRWFGLFVVVAVLAAGLRAGDDAKRIPVPDKADLAKAEKTIIDIFGDAMAKVKSAEAKRDLAADLLKQGEDPQNDAVHRYVLYRMAREWAARAGDAGLA